MDRRKFLTSGGIGLLGLTMRPALAGRDFYQYPHPVQHGLTNWAGNVHFDAKTMLAPKTLAELQQMVRDTSYVKVLGTRHSFNTIAKDDRGQISLNHLPSEVSVDPATMRATIPGHMPLKVANRLLEKLGYSIPIMGQIAEQTVAGIFATGTHGSSLYHGTVGDKVVAVKVITASGDLLELDESRPEDERLLRAFRLHLGALGIIVELQIQVEPLFYLSRLTRIMPVSDALERKLHEEHDYVQLYVLPYTNKAIVFTSDRIPKSECRYDEDLIDETIIDNVISPFLFGLSSLHPPCLPGLMRTIARTYPTRHASHVSYKILLFKMDFKLQDMELAVDYNDTAEAMETLNRRLAEEARTSGFYWNLPVCLRFVKGVDRADLSPTDGREHTTYISTTCHHSFVSKFEGPYRRLERDLVRSHGARPHWGKRFWFNPLSRYPHAASFVAAMNELDPTGKFRNPFVQQLIDGTDT